MAQDYAKKHASNPAPKPEAVPWVWFVVGFLLGLFTAFIIYLWQEVTPDPSSTTAKPTADVIANKQNDDEGKLPNYSFFEMFPNVVVPVVEEYSNGGEKISVEENCIYVLQAGSFRDIDDANRLRGELILMDMSVSIKEVDTDGTPWHRVIVGPFETKLNLTRTKTRLAGANIESIQLRNCQ